MQKETSIPMIPIAFLFVYFAGHMLYNDVYRLDRRASKIFERTNSHQVSRIEEIPKLMLKNYDGKIKLGEKHIVFQNTGPHGDYRWHDYEIHVFNENGKPIDINGFLPGKGRKISLQNYKVNPDFHKSVDKENAQNIKKFLRPYFPRSRL